MDKFITLLLALVILGSATLSYAEDRPSLKNYQDNTMQDDVQDDELLDS